MSKILRSTIPYKGPETENIIEFLRNGLRKNSDQVILIDSDSDRRWTGSQLEIVISRIAKFFLDEYQLKVGDVCSIYSDRNDEAAILILAIISAGGVANMIGGYRSHQEVLGAVGAAKPKLFISHGEGLDTNMKGLSDVDKGIKFIRIDDSSDCLTNDYRGISDLFMQVQSDIDLDYLVENIKIVPDSCLGMIQFSSGTTGKPKPIGRTHKNLCHVATSPDHPELVDLCPGQVMTGKLSLDFRPGIWTLMAAIKKGGTIVRMTSSDVEDLLRVVEKYKVTILHLSVPDLVSLANIGVQLASKYDTSKLEHIITAGSKLLNSQQPEILIKTFNLKSVRQSFGTTECGLIFLIELSKAKGKYLTVGHVTPGLEVVVMDHETNKILGTNDSGEIAVRGPLVFPGYLTDTPGKFNRGDFTEDGWFKLGDQGHYDESELMFIDGRYKEILNYGLRYSPHAVEAVLVTHSAVEDACVVKVGERKENYINDIIAAFVTLKPNCSVSENELMDLVTEAIPLIKLEAGIKILDKFPRTQSGKIDKGALKQLCL